MINLILNKLGMINIINRYNRWLHTNVSKIIYFNESHYNQFIHFHNSFLKCSLIFIQS